MRCRILIIISWSWFIFIYFTGPISLLNTLQPHCWAGCNRFGRVFGGRFFERYEGKNRASWKNMLMCRLYCIICLHMHDRLIDVSPLFVCSNWQLYWYLHYYTPLPTLLTVVYVCTGCWRWTDDHTTVFRTWLQVLLLQVSSGEGSGYHNGSACWTT